jgi:hypothetical protein
MRLTARIGLAGMVALVALATIASTAQAGFGVAKWEAGTCKSKGCTKNTPEQFYTQAAGHPPYGITDFKFNTNKTTGEAEGHVEEVRVDIPVGLSVNPFALPQCKLSELEGAGCPPMSRVGEVLLTVRVGVLTQELPAIFVYNMEPPPGKPLEAAFKVPLTEEVVHIVGGIDWSGDYHEFFTIKEIPASPELIESRLIFLGQREIGGELPFITMPSTCIGPQTTFLKVRSHEGQEETVSFKTPVGADGCDKIPFEPQVSVTPTSTQSDRPDGATVEVKVPQNAEPEGTEVIDSSTLNDAHVTLPEGMTLNPAAASGLEACSDAQFGKGTESPVGCPAGSQIGTVTVETPDLPAKALTGAVYVGQPLDTNPESGNEYRIFMDAEAPRYGVSVRLLGSVKASAATGQLTTAVLENPQVPFSEFIVNLGGPHVPLANPLACGPVRAGAELLPYSGATATTVFSSPFTVDSDGKGAACPGPLPFALTQSTKAVPTTGGASSSFTFDLARDEGQQYLSKLTVKLPPGLVARVPNVTLCGEAQASSDKCPAASKIGTVTVAAGSGPHPLTLGGTVYFTGPYGGAPYGLLVAVPADKVGPFDYGTIVTRATVGIDPYTARVTVASTLPTIVGGAPLRLRSLSVDTNHPDFVVNPTNCGVLATETLASSTFGASQLISTPFQASGCDALGFAPSFTAATDAKASRKDGAALNVTVGYPAGAQANIKSVVTQLPKQLPARLSTLNKACTEAVFNANPASCPHESNVGSATVTTPVLPGKLTGSAYFVSHGGASFPDLDIVLRSEGGVEVILVGNTNIAAGITTSTFASIPDVPVSSFELHLPTGPFSALAANGSLCAKPLIMPTTITAQNGKVVKQDTKISVAGCRAGRAAHGVRILSRRVRGHRLILTLKVPGAGKVTVGGRGLRKASKRVRKAGRVRVTTRLSRVGLRALARAHKHHRRLRVRVKVRFAPSKGHVSFAFTKVRFG